MNSLNTFLGHSQLVYSAMWSPHVPACFASVSGKSQFRNEVTKSWLVFNASKYDAGDSIAIRRVTHARQVKGDKPDEKSKD